MRIYLNTWRCAECDYSIDIAPTTANYSRLGFEKIGLRVLTAGECPACKQRGQVGEMVPETDPARMSRIDVASDAQIESRKIDSGKKRIDGTRIMRALTPNEISARKRERDTWVASIQDKIHSIEE